MKKQSLSRLGSVHREKRAGGATPLELAVARARKIDAALVSQLVGALEATLSTMRFQGASLSDAVEFERAILVATFIEREGVIKGLGQKIKPAAQAIDDIKCRLQEAPGQRTPLYGEEITSLDDLVYWHGVQLKEISYGEYARVLQRSAGQMDAEQQARINRALRGAL